MPRDDDDVKWIRALPGSVATSSISATIAFGPDALKFTAPDVQPPPDDHPIYSMIGRIASSWAHVERLFDQMIWDLADLDGQKGACITAQLPNIAARCNTIIAQLTLLESKEGLSTRNLVSTMTDIRNKSNGPGEPRNRAVHDPWYVYTKLEQTAQYRAMPARDLRFGLIPVDHDDLEKTLNSIREFSERVSKFKDDVSALLASRKKSGAR